MKTKRNINATPGVCLSVLFPGLLALGLNFTPAGAAVGAEGAGRKALPGQTNAAIRMGSVVAAAVDDSGNLYIGGDFNPASVPGNHIDRWNGSSWSPLGSEMGGGHPLSLPYVLALAVSGTNLYAGGMFTMAGGIAANYIAQWNGSGWSPLGSGMGGKDYLTHVRALAVSGTDLYAGGNFTTAGGSRANYIAKWNGSSWSALGSGMGGRMPVVNALAVSGTNLYAGGWFTTAGGHAANCMAQWNGSSWSPLGSGMGGLEPPYSPCVNALAVSGNNLYAGGYFRTAGGITASHVARWDGSRWIALGSGIRGVSTLDLVHALAVSGPNLYVGGSFTKAGGNAANYVAQWDGSWWRALGSGLNENYPLHFVNALAVSGGTLYAGGSLTTVDGNAAKFSTAGYIMSNAKKGVPYGANYVAQWNGSSWSVVGAGVR